MMYWLMKRILLGPLMQTVYRPWSRGLENIPTEGPALLASNHHSVVDSFFLPLVCPRRITFPAKKEYFTGTGLKGRLTAAFFRGVGQVPVDRSGGAAGQAALDAARQILDQGELFGIYPEGTRSPDGRLYRGKTGVARLALEAQVPVIPVAMIGTDILQPEGRTIPHIGRVGIVVGEPLDFSRYYGMSEDRTVVRAVTDEIMRELSHLSNQEYVDEYAAAVKKRRSADRLKAVAAGAQATAEHVRDRALEAGDKARQAGEKATLKAREVTERATEKMRETSHQALDGDVAARVSQSARVITERAKEMSHRAAQATERALAERQQAQGEVAERGDAESDGDLKSGGGTTSGDAESGTGTTSRAVDGRHSEGEGVSGSQVSGVADDADPGSALR